MRTQVTIDRQAGLPSNQVHRIDQDGLGRLWLAGPSGLVCYDGSRVRTFDRRHGLSCAGLRAVKLGADGSVWIGTDLGVEVMDQTGRVVAGPVGALWPFGLVGSILSTADGAWLGTSRGVVQVFGGTSQGALAIGASYEVGYVRDMVWLDDQRLLAVSATLGLLVVDAKGFRRLDHERLPAPEAMRRVALAPGGQILLGATDGVCVLSAAGQPQSHCAAELGRSHHVVGALAVDGTGCWVGIGRQLIGFESDAEGGLREVYRTEVGSRINDIMVDGWGNVWVATDSSGVERLSGLRGALRRIELAKGAAVYVLRPQPDGKLAIGGDGFDAELALDGLPGARAVLHDELPSTVWDICPDGQGGRWLATHAGLFHVKPGGQPVLRSAGSEPLGAPCRVLMRRGESLWVGTLGGLVRLDGNHATDLCDADGRRLGYVYLMQEDAQGRLWVGTLGRGLWREGEHGLEPVVGGPLTSSGNTCAVAFSPDGSQLLVLQDERIVLMSLGGEEAPRLIATEHPVAGWTALWLDARRVAIGSSEGLRVLDTQTGLVDYRVNALLGASAWEFTNNRSLVQGPDGLLYCGVNGGLLAVDLPRLARFRVPPEVRLAETRWRGVNARRSGAVEQVDPGKWTLEVRAFVAWMIDERQVRLRFRLAGFDEDWSALQQAPEVRYSSLPPGRYTLQAQAYAPLAGMGPVVELLQIEVSARKWAGMLALASSWYDRLLGMTLRNQRLMERHRQLEAEVGERTRALAAANEELQHSRDALDLRSRTDALTGWANRREFDERFSNELVRARRTRQPLAVLMVDVDHFKRFNDRYGHPMGDEALRGVTRQMGAVLRPYDVHARYGGEEFVILLPNTDAATMQLVAERLCGAVRDMAMPHADSAAGVVTVSIGGVASSDGAAAELLSAADQALYRAKQGGRDRFVAGELAPP